MLINCPTHGETEAYARGSYPTCKKCCRAKQLQYRAQKKANTFVQKRPTVTVYAPREPYVQYAPASKDLTCNRPECGKVCVDAHELYTHKRGEHSTVRDGDSVIEERSPTGCSLNQP